MSQAAILVRLVNSNFRVKFCASDVKLSIRAKLVSSVNWLRKALITNKISSSAMLNQSL